VRRTGLRSTHPCLSLAAWRAPPQSTRTRVAGVTSDSGEIYLFSIVVGFGVVTLFATGLLFVMQILEDFRDA
jgi:hypothetical protein